MEPIRPVYPITSYDAHPPSDVPLKKPKTDFIPAGELLVRLKIIKAQNERLARKMDAARILDEFARDDEAIRDYYYAPKVPSFQILKRSYDNQAFHFKDEEK